MCLATPIKITKIEGKKAKVEHNGHDHEVSTVLIPKAKVGDWIMAHGDLAISVMPEDHAKELLSLASQCHCHTGHKH